MKLLVIEDETPMRELLDEGLSREGYAVDAVATGSQADEAVDVYDYDAILLDVLIPEGDGFSLCRKWRKRGVSTPIIFLTAVDDVPSRIKGLDLGGDDYLVKPFAFDELLARLRVITRRGAIASRPATIEIGDLQLDTASHEVRRRGIVIHLTTREYQILEYLVLEAGQIVSRSKLWEHIWETDYEPDSNVVDVFILALRKKLGRDPDLIETVRGSGYRFTGR